MKVINIFHKLSYFQYPTYLFASYYYIIFILSLIETQPNWSNLNNFLLFAGIAISLSTLQDTSKTQNKLSENVWKSPKKGKRFLILMGLFTIFCLIGGLIGFLRSEENIHKEISFGLIVLGIGFVGLLKAANEMFENHRSDKNLKKVLKEDEDLLHKLSK